MARRTRRPQRPEGPADRPPQKRRRGLWLISVAVVLAAGVYGVVRYRTGWARPALNVLLITLDTTRADYLGCYGRPGGRTPVLDRLAREGVLFTDCTACSPFTSPSHASLLTSLYPYAHGVRLNGADRLAEEVVTLAESFRDAGYTTQATVASYVVNRKFGLAQGFDVYHDVTEVRVGDELHAERRGDVVCADAIQMLQSLVQKRFFLWVHFYDPHHPYHSTRGHERDTPEAYEDEIAFMDAQIGHLMQQLSQLRLAESTLVVLVGDHGEGLGEHGERLHGVFLYQSTLRVPLIFYGPGRIQAGRSVAAQVRTVDVAPTILALAGLRAWSQAQGVSLVPLLTGRTADLGLAAYAESLDGQQQFGLAMLRSLSQGGWKYVHAPTPELYDLARDPGELQNLHDAEPARAEPLRAALRALIADAPPPPAPAAAAPPDAKDVAILASLGYVVAPSMTGPQVPEIDRFEPLGGDPKDYAKLFDLTARAGGAMVAGLFERAEQRLREALAIMPDRTSLHIQLAHALYEQKKYAEADEVYRRVLEWAPEDPEVRRQYGWFLLYQANRPADAAVQLGAVLARTPDDVDLLHDVGVALIATGKHGEGERCLTRALELDRDNVRAIQALGALRVQQQRWSEAEQLFVRALQLSPSSVEAQRGLQWVRQKLGKS